MTDPKQRSGAASTAVASGYLIVAIQNVTLVNLAGFAFKPVHLAFLGLSIAAIACTPVLPRALAPVRWYLVAVITGTCIPYFVEPISPVVVNYIFVLMLVLVLPFLAARAEYWAVLRGLRVGAAAVVLYSGANVLLHLAEVQASRGFAVASGARPRISGMVYAGGINMEASWTAMAAAFFVRNPRLFVCYSIPALWISLALSSRTAILIWCVAAVACAWEVRRSASGIVSGLAVLAIGVAAFVPLATALGQVNVVARFAAIGNEPGSEGRLSIMDGALAAIQARPLVGYGLGNEMQAAREFGAVATQDNVHNLVLGNTLALGVIGGVAYLIMGMMLYVRLRGRSEARVYLIALLVASMVEFRGADVPFYFVVTALGAAALESVRRKEQDGRSGLSRSDPLLRSRDALAEDTGLNRGAD